MPLSLASTSPTTITGLLCDAFFTLHEPDNCPESPLRIGAIWGFAGIGLLIGGSIGHVAGHHTNYAGYKRAVTISYLVHGFAYMLFSQAESFLAALICMMFSRVGMAVTSVLNNSQLLHHTPNQFRGRIFAALESIRWPVMIVSMAAAGIASQYTGPRTVGLVAGALGSVTAIAWAWWDWSGRLPEPMPVEAGRATLPVPEGLP